MTLKPTLAAMPFPPPSPEVAAQLEAAAALIDASPGLNVLDALRRANQDAKADELLIGQTYYTLLDYLPPHVEYVAPWSDAETSERVAAKLRQLARTIRKGGPAKIGAHPEDGAIVRELESVHNRNPSKAKRTYSPAGKLRLERGVMASGIVRMERAAHPNLAKIQQARDRIIALDAQLDQLDAADRDATRDTRPLVGLRRIGTESGL